MKLSDKQDSSTQRVLLFGPPKSGKSKLAGGLSAQFNLLWFDLENGYITLRQFPKEWQERIELISIPDTKDYPIAVETMMKVLKGTECLTCQEHGKVSCMICRKAVPAGAETRVCLQELGSDTIVVIDSLTQLSNSTMSHLLKGQTDDYRIEWDDYRRQGALLDRCLSNIQQAKYNIVCITHEVETEMEDGKKKLVPVAGTANFSRNTAKYFDHVVYCEVKNRKHAFASATTYAGNVLTGSRTDATMESMEQPSLISIFKPGIVVAQVAQVAPTTNTQGLSALEKLKAMKQKST